MPDYTPPPLPDVPPPLTPSRAYVDPTKDNRGVQAAKFSLYAPLLALILGCVSMSLRNGAANRGASNSTTADYHTVGLILGCVNIGLITIGLALGIYALISMRRFGRTGILGRAIAGVALNGLFAAMMVIALFAFMWLPGRTSAKIVGSWHITSSPKMTPGTSTNATFRPDGTFDLDITQRGQSGKVSGHWELLSGRVIGVTIDDVGPNGDRSKIGSKMLLGEVEQVDDQSMRLKVEGGEEVYQRR